MKLVFQSDSDVKFIFYQLLQLNEAALLRIHLLGGKKEPRIMHIPICIDAISEIESQNEGFSLLK